jgi:hypothetical protein
VVPIREPSLPAQRGRDIARVHSGIDSLELVLLSLKAFLDAPYLLTLALTSQPVLRVGNALTLILRTL